GRRDARQVGRRRGGAAAVCPTPFAPAGHNTAMTGGANPADRRYTTEHEWVKSEGQHYIVGITAFAQDQLGDIVYVELPKVGDRVESGKPFGVIESCETRRAQEAPLAAQRLA